MTASRTALRNWYLENKRDLPWRDDPSAYKTWLSEIILQQTRVAQGLDYYLRFVEQFPSVEHLAAAHEDQVLKLWQGLGYYSRARNLHAAAKRVVEAYEGHFPDSYEALLSLKGVGPYTAAAIASIAFGLPHAVVDGNVIRVITRLHGIEAAVELGQTAREIQRLADDFLDHHHPGDHNQAIMELGATLCTPRSPHCPACPLNNTCMAFKNGTAERIPVKRKKVKRRARYFHYLIGIESGKVAIQRRDTNDIWAGLYEFPLIETENKGMLSKDALEAGFNVDQMQVHRVNAGPKHVLSHQDIFAHFYHASFPLVKTAGYRIVSLEELHTFALPRLIDRYLENYDSNGGKKRH
ncbi:MAG: A/G-specific adenine glycosylase [Cryomorphaceae bacterium]